MKDKKYKRILAIGDIHGCAYHLQKLLAAVEPTKEDLLVTLGDYIDRGPNSKGVIDILLSLHQDRKKNIVSVRGNHDALPLMCLDDGLNTTKKYYPEIGNSDREVFKRWRRVSHQEPADLWWENQAAATLSSYARNKGLNKGLRDVSGEMRKMVIELIPQEHIEFLRDTCVDACETDDFIFVHGGLCPDLPLTEQPLFALHWTRFDETWKPHISGKKVICGHTPLPDFQVHDLDYATCVDTGAFMARGFLTCMDVLSGQLWQIDDDLRLVENPLIHYTGCSLLNEV
ncbi:MAG: metallophosphoesterase family protein [Rectinemataceae bacterium]|nr:metallophosphoesterase family protein [Rectinemataceae bacterium]